jgi:tRNA dimethylallyltransferase
MSSIAASGGSDPGAAAHPIRVVAGPTAVGKTAVGIALARRLGGEILACDSRQVYRGMAIGSAQPTAAERALIRHHLVDFADPLRHYTAADFARDARAVLADLDLRSVPPVVVGGSGLYLRAFIGGLFAGPGREPEVRAALEARAEREGSRALHEELGAVDPETQGRLHPHDRVRIVRALEVHAVSGRPLSVWQREHATASLAGRTQIVVLDREPEDLDARIAARSRSMFDAGLLDEAKALLGRGLTTRHAAYRTIGYDEAFQVLTGMIDVESAIERATRATRQFARRQRTWFRAEKKAHWMLLAQEATPEETAHAWPIAGTGVE